MQLKIKYSDKFKNKPLETKRHFTYAKGFDVIYLQRETNLSDNKVRFKNSRPLHISKTGFINVVKRFSLHQTKMSSDYKIKSD